MLVLCIFLLSLLFLMLLAVPHLSSGGVPGGVLDGEGDLPGLLRGDVIRGGGIQAKHMLFGLGP